VQMLRTLIGAKARIDANTLFAAITSVMPEIEDVLHERGVTPDVANTNGRTALFLAAEEDNSEAAERLLEWHTEAGHSAGKSVNLKDNKGITPLMVAAEKGSGNVGKLLVNGRASLNMKDNEGNTVLHYADDGNQGDVFDYLVDQGADQFAENNKGRKPQKPGEGGCVVC